MLTSHPAGPKPSRVRRWIGLPLLLVYTGLLVTSALVDEVRPSFLDRPQALARSALGAFGIRAGHELMRASYPGDYRSQAYCMIVRGEGGESPSVFLFPEDGRCPDSGLRPRLPPVERALYRLLRHAWWNQIVSERPGAPPRALARSRYTLKRIGRHFCTRPEMADRSDASVSLVWYVYEVGYESGHRRRTNYLQLRWLCESERLVDVLWAPGDEILVRFWGSEPWSG